MSLRYSSPRVAPTTFRPPHTGSQGATSSTTSQFNKSISMALTRPPKGPLNSPAHMNNTMPNLPLPRLMDIDPFDVSRFKTDYSLLNMGRRQQQPHRCIDLPDQQTNTATSPTKRTLNRRHREGSKNAQKRRVKLLLNREYQPMSGKQISRQEQTSNKEDGEKIHSLTSPTADSKLIISKRAKIPRFQTINCHVQAPKGLYMVDHRSSEISILPALIQGKGEDEDILLPINNVSEYVLTLAAGRELSSAHPVQEDELTPICYQDFLPEPTDSGKPLAEYFNTTHLEPNEKEALLGALTEFPEVFLTEGKKLKRTNVLEFSINLETNQPVARPPYPAPRGYEEKLDQLLMEMKDQGILEDTSSGYAAPVVLIRKRLPSGEESTRVCFDYRYLNKITRSETFPPILIHELISSFYKKTRFTTLDLAHSYWQLNVKKEDRPKLAVISKKYHLQPTCMPFGLKNAPMVFNRMLNRVLGDLPGARTYIDDIIIASETLEEHVEILHQVLQRLEKANLMIKPSKVNLYQKSVRFLGLMLDENGVSTDPDKVAAIVKSSPPRNPQVRQFLGSAGFFRSFIPKFSQIARPLFQLTKKDVKFVWTTECQMSFDQLKRRLTEAPVLRYPAQHLPYELHTDSSKIGLGAVLLQKFDDGWHPICYLSRSLSAPEKNYPISELEMTCVVWAIKKLHYYLAAVRFRVVTDHVGLTVLFKIRESLNSRLARYNLILSTYDFDIVYRPGKQHLCPDHLSRLPEYEDPNPPTPPPKLLDLENEVAEMHRLIQRAKPVVIYDSRPTVNTIQAGYEPVLDRDFIKKEQEHDPFCKDITHQLTTHPDAEIGFALDFEKLLYKTRTGASRHDQLVVPATLRRRFLHAYHDHPLAGHGGVNSTYNRMRQKLYWPGLLADIRQYVRACVSCNCNKPDLRGFKAPLKTIITATSPNEILSADLVGPLPLTDNRNRYIFTCIDSFTKWIILVPIPDAKASTVAAALVDHVILKRGCPAYLTVDNGTMFTGATFRAVCDLLKVRLIYTECYRPQQSLIERSHSLLRAKLTHYLNNKGSDWDQFLPMMAAAINSTPHTSTKDTPFFLEHGRDFVSIYDQIIEPRKINYNYEDNYAQQLLARLQLAYQEVCQNQTQAFETSKAQYDKRASPVNIAAGDIVYLKNFVVNPGTAKKWTLRFTGPWRVLQKVGDATFRIKQIYGRKTVTAHAEKLKPALEPGTPFTADYEVSSEEAGEQDNDPEDIADPPQQSSINETDQAWIYDEHTPPSTTTTETDHGSDLASRKNKTIASKDAPNQKQYENPIESGTTTNQAVTQPVRTTRRTQSNHQVHQPRVKPSSGQETPKSPSPQTTRRTRRTKPQFQTPSPSPPPSPDSHSSTNNKQQKTRTPVTKTTTRQTTSKFQEDNDLSQSRLRRNRKPVGYYRI